MGSWADLARYLETLEQSAGSTELKTLKRRALTHFVRDGRIYSRERDGRSQQDVDYV